MKQVSLYTDGGARGNPGPAAIGYVIYADSKRLAAHGEKIGKATNNQAEYRALIAGLRKCLELGATVVHCFSDSKLVVNQLNGDWKVKNKGIRVLYLSARKHERAFERITHSHRPRDTAQIEVADRFVNDALDGLI